MRVTYFLQFFLRNCDGSDPDIFHSALFPHVSWLSVETESSDQQGYGENISSAGDVTEKGATLSSSAAGERVITVQCVHSTNVSLS